MAHELASTEEDKERLARFLDALEADAARLERQAELLTEEMFPKNGR
jgi:hypothetical protein